MCVDLFLHQFTSFQFRLIHSERKKLESDMYQCQELLFSEVLEFYIVFPFSAVFLGLHLIHICSDD